MKISVVGTGYVGLVTGACLAETGNEVVCLDSNQQKIESLLAGNIPFFEPGLEEVVKRNVAAGRLAFTTDPKRSALHGLIQFIAVGTNASESGSADLQHVYAAAHDIGQTISEYAVIAIKSTVPVGTGDAVRAIVQTEIEKRKLQLNFSVVSNPEFLKEGSAVEDFNRPDRIVLGADDESAIKIMRELYAPYQRNHERLILMDVKSSELTKYAANGMLATRISFMNELANLADKVGADIDLVRKGVGSDHRIG